MSRIGKKPVPVPAGVTASISGQTIEVKGPKGALSFTATDDVTIALEDGAVTVKPRGRQRLEGGLEGVGGLDDGAHVWGAGAVWRAASRSAVVCATLSRM